MSQILNASTGLSRRRHLGPLLSEMNVVPLIDVMLVLLIIFMMTAQAMQSGLEVKVPEIKHVQDTAQDLPIVTVFSTGVIFLDKTPLNINALPTEINRRFKGAEAVYVSADRELKYDTLAQVISALKDAKLQINLVMTPEELPRK